MASTRERADRAVGGVVLACGLLVAGFLVWHLTGLGSDSVRTLVADGVYPPLAVVFTVLGFRAARHPGLDPRSRLAWHVIAAAFAVRLVAYCVWFAEDALLQRTAYPAVADYWFLAFDPIMVAGLLLLPGADRTRRDKMKLALDALIVGVGTFMVLWYLVLGEIFAESGATFAEIFFSAALPIGDLVLVLAAVTVLMRRKGAAGLPVRLLAASTASFVVADVYYTYVQLHVGFVGGAWPDLFWTLSCLLLIVAAQRQHQQADDRRTTERGRGTALTWLPYGAVALAYGMLGALVPGQKLYPIGGMIVGAATLTALVVARQMYALRENRDLAVTDTLTGLANRTLVTERLVQLSG